MRAAISATGQDQPTESQSALWSEAVQQGEADDVVIGRVLGRQLVLPQRKITSLAEFTAAFPGATKVLVDGMERPI
jgi:hypothetical protein